MTLDDLKALPPDGKASMRKLTRRKLGECLRLLCKPQSPENRAFLSGYVEYGRKALEALS